MLRFSQVVRAISLLAAVLPLAGHDLYMMPEKFVVPPGAQLRVLFQNGDAFPKGSNSVKPERLRNTRLLSRAGSADFDNITDLKTHTTAMVRVPGAGLAILTAHTIPTFIRLEAEKFKSYLTHENLTAPLKWRQDHGEAGKPGLERYSKYVKSLIQSGQTDGYFAERAGLTIEIIPEADPYLLHAGAKLPVQVLFRGKPAANVAVESAWLEKGVAKIVVVGRTDAAGKVIVPVKASGPHRLHAIVMERCAEPKIADWESFWASLTFEIPSGH